MCVGKPINYSSFRIRNLPMTICSNFQAKNSWFRSTSPRWNKSWFQKQVIQVSSKWSSCHHIDPLPPTAEPLEPRISGKVVFFESHGGSCGGHMCPKRAKTPCIWGNQTQTVVMKHPITNISLTFIDSLLIQLVTFMSSLTWMQTCNLTGKFDTLAIKFTTSASASDHSRSTSLCPESLCPENRSSVV